MEQTPNYQLSQWESTDRILREDFNSDNAKIDAALAAEKAAREAAVSAETEARTALAGQVAKLGNCQLYTTTYKGTGTYGADHPTSLTFPRKPVLTFIFEASGRPCCFLGRDQTSAMVWGADRDTHRISVTWTGNTLRWSSTQTTTHQLNASGYTYHVIALLAMDA